MNWTKAWPTLVQVKGLQEMATLKRQAKAIEAGINRKQNKCEKKLVAIAWVGVQSKHSTLQTQLLIVNC